MFSIRFYLISVLFLLCSVCLAQPVVKISVLRPSDQPFVHKHETDAIRSSVTQVQAFFASEMNRFGYGKKTFEFERHIPVYIGVEKLSEYEADVDVVRWQHGHAFQKAPNDIHLIFLAGTSSIGGAGGVFTHRCDNTGNCDFRRLVVVPLEGNEEYRSRIIAHELGHAFGFLEHLPSRERYIMESYLLINIGSGEEALYNYQLHPEVAKVINASKDLSVVDGVDTSKFDRIVRRPDSPKVDVNDNSRNTDNIEADVNADGYVDLSDVLIVRSAIQNSVSYDTDVNDDGKTDEVDVMLVKQKAMEAIVAAAPTLYRQKRSIATIWAR